MPLEVSQPSDLSVRVVRTFRAPRQLVWDAHTRPELLRRWCGFPDWTMPVCEMDVREGGTYRWRWRNDADGTEIGFHGTFTAVDAPSRLAHDQYFDPGDGDAGGAMPVGDPCRVTVELSEANGVTTLVSTMTFASKADRDDAMSTGMTDGMEVSYGRLDGLICQYSAVSPALAATATCFRAASIRAACPASDRSSISSTATSCSPSRTSTSWRSTIGESAISSSTRRPGHAGVLGAAGTRAARLRGAAGDPPRPGALAGVVAPGRATVADPRHAIVAVARRPATTARRRGARRGRARPAQVELAIGERVHREVLEERRAEYGARIVSAAGRQLAARYGRGFDEKSLRHMIRFARAFPSPEIVSAHLGARGIHVAEYLTELPPRQVLAERLHRAIEAARNQLVLGAGLDAEVHGVSPKAGKAATTQPRRRR